MQAAGLSSTGIESLPPTDAFQRPVILFPTYCHIRDECCYPQDTSTYLPVHTLADVLWNAQLTTNKCYAHQEQLAILKDQVDCQQVGLEKGASQFKIIQERNDAESKTIFHVQTQFERMQEWCELEESSREEAKTKVGKLERSFDNWKQVLEDLHCKNSTLQTDIHFAKEKMIQLEKENESLLVLLSMLTLKPASDPLTSMLRRLEVLESQVDLILYREGTTPIIDDWTYPSASSESEGRNSPEPEPVDLSGIY